MLLTTKPLKLHLGCGHIRLDDYVNVDKFNPKADVQADLLSLPFPDESAEVVVANHVIEHISWQYQMRLYEEFHRVLQPDGVLKLGYPEWEECAKNFLSNQGGIRWKWWVQTLYGSQHEPGQQHLAPIVTSRLVEQLTEVGFKDFDYCLTGADAQLVCVRTQPLPWF